ANIQKAAARASQCNPYLAWDVIIEVSRTESDDLVLAKTRSDIAPLVAEYARLIGLAEKLEKEGADAAALASWLAAQDLNPASVSCADSVKRLAGKVAQAAPVKSAAVTPAPPPAGEDEVPVPVKGAKGS
ncbi:MAG: hypothetical protein ACO3ND_07355, partial [Opitutales bacterium]